MPGAIKPRVEREVVATYDIFTTAVKLAGAELPNDRIIDGVDLSSLLFKTHEEESSPIHDCVYHYKGSPWEECDYSSCPGLWAVRCGDFKLHYVTSNSVAGGGSSIPTFHEPPLIFHIERDPSENYPLDVNGSEWSTAYTTISAQVSIHKSGLEQVPNQMRMGSDISNRICCDASINCLCDADNLEVFVCAPIGEDCIIGGG